MTTDSWIANRIKPRDWSWGQDTASLKAGRRGIRSRIAHASTPEFLENRISLPLTFTGSLLFQIHDCASSFHELDAA